MNLILVLVSTQKYIRLSRKMSATRNQSNEKVSAICEKQQMSSLEIDWRLLSARELNSNVRKCFNRYLATIATVQKWMSLHYRKMCVCFLSNPHQRTVCWLVLASLINCHGNGLWYARFVLASSWRSTVNIFGGFCSNEPFIGQSHEYLALFVSEETTTERMSAEHIFFWRFKIEAKSKINTWNKRLKRISILYFNNLKLMFRDGRGRVWFFCM